MENKKWAIPYPTDEEIEQQVASIIKQGLPVKQTFIHLLLDLKRQIGWKYVFLSYGEALFSGLITLMIFGYIWLIADDIATESFMLNGMFFMLSPLVFLSLTAYAYYQKRSNNTFELEMTMKYTVFQLLVCRMLFFSGIAILVNMSFILILSFKVEIDIFRLLLLSLTGLFLFSTGLLLSLYNGQVFNRSLVFIIAWILGNTLLLLTVGQQYARILDNLPIAVYSVLLIGVLALYLYSFKRLMTKNQEGVFEC
ncbi:hypothetical protein [Lysinibacillus sp. NPDC096212]|uniref:hypothetical protein n=1 Tax=unclassified Lysinibacillus TaxID=2636778 RepID=UPI003824139C